METIDLRVVVDEISRSAKSLTAISERLVDLAECLLAEVDGGQRAYFSPVGTEQERNSSEIWPGAWVDATGYLRWYALGWHTGADLNLNSPHWDADRHAPVYAIADGEVYAVRTDVQGWHTVVCIRHADCLSRYAHVENIQVWEGQRVRAGQHIANIGNAGGNYPFHLHVDIARLTARMAQYPLDWPGKAADAKERVERDYLDPAEFLRGRV
jgi:murein DD-endopeptidase MepM/ murein hydrolase activator NlpD